MLYLHPVRVLTFLLFPGAPAVTEVVGPAFDWLVHPGLGIALWAVPVAVWSLRPAYVETLLLFLVARLSGACLLIHTVLLLVVGPPALRLAEWYVLHIGIVVVAVLVWTVRYHLVSEGGVEQLFLLAFVTPFM